MGRKKKNEKPEEMIDPIVSESAGVAEPEPEPEEPEEPEPEEPKHYCKIKGSFILPDGRVIDSTNRHLPLDKKAIDDLSFIAQKDGGKNLLSDMIRDGRIEVK